MKNKKVLLVAATVGGLLGGNLQVAEAAAKKSSKDAQIQALERRLRLLEQRLESREAPQAQAAKPTVSRLAEADTPTVRQLDQKVKILERKLEVEKEVAENEKKSAPTFEAGPEGFKWTSANKEHQLRLRGYVQADGNFFLDDSTGGLAGLSSNSYGNGNAATPGGVGLAADKFTIRRARLLFAGTLWKNVDFLISPDFGGGQARLFDGWIDLHYFPFASVTAGKMKGPVSLERLQSATSLLFAERSYPTQLAPNRAIGVMLHGELAAPGRATRSSGPFNFGDLLTYQAGVFNVTEDNQAVQNSDTATFDNKEFEGRIFGHPFQLTKIEALQRLGVGIAGTYSNPTQSSIPQLVSPGQSRIVSYSPGVTGFSGVSGSGNHYRIYPQAYWYYGPYGLFGEYVLSSQELNNTVTSGGISQVRSIRQNNHAWQVAASYVLTGEDNSFSGVRPRQPFNPATGNWGALQLAARWSELDIDGETFRNYGTAAAPRYLFADPRNSVQHATSWALGVNWFLNSNVKLTADYEQTYFRGGAQNTRFQVFDRPAEKVFLTRFQLSY